MGHMGSWAGPPLGLCAQPPAPQHGPWAPRAPPPPLPSGPPCHLTSCVAWNLQPLVRGLAFPVRRSPWPALSPTGKGPATIDSGACARPRSELREPWAVFSLRCPRASESQGPEPNKQNLPVGNVLRTATAGEPHCRRWPGPSRPGTCRSRTVTATVPSRSALCCPWHQALTWEWSSCHPGRDHRDPRPS